MAVFRIRPRKRLRAEQKRTFWEDFDAGLRTRKKLGQKNNPRPFLAVTKSTAGTVREFHNREDMLKELREMKALSQEIMARKPQSFELQPVEILALDAKNLRWLERVYPAPTVHDFHEVSFKSRYYSYFIKKLKRKGIELHEAQKIVREAYRELEKIGPSCDATDENVLVLDIDLKSKKALFALIDLGRSKRHFKPRIT